jgi:hypothetical protein
VEPFPLINARPIDPDEEVTWTVTIECDTAGSMIEHTFLTSNLVLARLLPPARLSNDETMLVGYGWPGKEYVGVIGNAGQLWVPRITNFDRRRRSRGWAYTSVAPQEFEVVCDLGFKYKHFVNGPVFHLDPSVCSNRRYYVVDRNAK